MNKIPAPILYSGNSKAFRCGFILNLAAICYFFNYRTGYSRETIGQSEVTDSHSAQTTAHSALSTVSSVPIKGRSVVDIFINAPGNKLHK